MNLTTDYMKAALGPYAMWLKPLAVAVLAGFIFVGGCNYGKQGKADEIVSLTAQVSTLRSANQSYHEAAVANNKQVKEALKKSADLLARAEKAEELLSKQRHDRDKAQEKRDAQLREALSDPRCTEVLEMNVCSVVPLP
jgi:ABC-type Fe3+-hydroxamate transport system substrate-binding protein